MSSVRIIRGPTSPVSLIFGFTLPLASKTYFFVFSFKSFFSFPEKSQKALGHFGNKLFQASIVIKHLEKKTKRNCSFVNSLTAFYKMRNNLTSLLA
jgi:hypothetical protein